MLLLALSLATARAGAPEPLPGADVPPPARLRDIPAPVVGWGADARTVLVAGRMDDTGAWGVGVAGPNGETTLPMLGCGPASSPGPARDAALAADGTWALLVAGDGAACAVAQVRPPAGLPDSTRRTALRGRFVRGALAPGMALLAREDGALEGHVLASGKRAWRRAAPVGAIAQLRVVARAGARDPADPRMAGRELLVAGARGIAVVDAATGRLVRAVFVGEARSVAADPNHLWAGMGDGSVLAIDRSTWTVVRTVRPAASDAPVGDLDVLVAEDGTARMLLTRQTEPAGDVVRAWDLRIDARVFEDRIPGPSTHPGTTTARARFAPGDTPRMLAGGPEHGVQWRRPDALALPRPVPQAEPARHRPLVTDGGEMMGLRARGPEEIPDAPVVEPPSIGDGRPLALLDAGVLVATPSGLARLEGAVATPLPGSAPATDARATDGRRVLAWTPQDGGGVIAWQGGTAEARFPLPAPPRDLHVDGRQVALVDADGALRAGSGAPRATTTRGVRRAAVHGATGRIAVGADDGTVRLVGGGARSDRSWRLFLGPVTALGWDPLGELLAAAGAHPGEGGGSVAFLAGVDADVEGQPVPWATEAPPRQVALAGRGDTRRSLARWDGGLAVRDVEGGLRLQLALPAVDATFRPGARGEAPSVEVLDTRGARLRLPLAAAPLPWTPPRVPPLRSPDGERAVTIEGDVLSVWSARTGRRLAVTAPLGSRPRASVYAPDGRTLAVVREDGAIDLVDLESGQPGRALAGPPTTLPAWAAFSPDGTVLWTLDATGAVVGVDVTTGETVARVTLHAADVARTRTGTAAEGGELAGFTHEGRTTWVHLARESTWRTTVTDTSTAPLVDLGPAPPGSPASASVRACWRVEETARCGDAMPLPDAKGRVDWTPAGARVYRLGPGITPTAAALTGTGHLALAGSDGRVQVHETAFGALVVALDLDAGTEGATTTAPARALAFTANGTELRVGLDRRFLWRVDQERRATPLGPGAVTMGSPVHAMRLDARDPTRAWTAHGDGTVRGWDLRTGAQVALLPGHVGAVRALGQRGDTLLSAGDDGVLRAWDATTGVGRDARWTFRCSPSDDPLLRCGPGAGLHALATEGDRVAVLGEDRIARVWRLPDSWDGGAPPPRNAPPDSVAAGALTLAGRWRLAEGQTLDALLGTGTPDGGSATRATLPEPLRPALERLGPPLAWTGTATRTLTAHADGHLRLWDSASGAMLAAVTPLSDGGWILDHANGERLASPSLRDGTDPPLYTR